MIFSFKGQPNALYMLFLKATECLLKVVMWEIRERQSLGSPGPVILCQAREEGR
jgi:hypothetical protein